MLILSNIKKLMIRKSKKAIKITINNAINKTHQHII